MAIISAGLMLLKFKNLGSFAAKNWKLVVIVILVAGIGYYHWDRTRTIDALREQVVDLKADFERCQGAVKRQNSVIDKLSTDGSTVLEQERKRAAEEIKKEQQKTQTAIDKLRKKETAQTCDAAIKELIDGAKGDLKWEE